MLESKVVRFAQLLADPVRAVSVHDQETVDNLPEQPPLRVILPRPSTSFEAGY